MTLPNFLIIGAGKSGTTSLYHYLGEHPEVFVSPIKETNFFVADGRRSEDHPVQSVAEYEALFEGVTSEHAIGEASPAYLDSPTAAARIAELLPNARLIAILRNPVDRAWSDYLMRIRERDEVRAPDEAFTDDAPFVRQGFYSERVERFTSRFAADQIRFFSFDDFSTDAVGVTRRCYEFLGVDPSFQPNVEVRHNAGWSPRNRALHTVLKSRVLRRTLKPVVPQAARNLVRGLAERAGTENPSIPANLEERLRQLYRDDLGRVSDLTGLDVSTWLEPQPVSLEA